MDRIEQIHTIFGEIMESAVKDECGAVDEWLLARLDRIERNIIANERASRQTEIAA